MVLHLRAPKPELEKSIRFVAKHVTNLMNCLMRQNDVDEETAWEITADGFLEGNDTLRIPSRNRYTGGAG